MAAWGVGLTASNYGQGVLGFSPLTYGLGTTVLTVGAVAGSFAGQSLVGRVGVWWVAAGGAVLLGVGALLLSGPSEHGGYWTDLRHEHRRVPDRRRAGQRRRDDGGGHRGPGRRVPRRVGRVAPAGGGRGGVREATGLELLIDGNPSGSGRLGERGWTLVCM